MRRSWRGVSGVKSPRSRYRDGQRNDDDDRVRSGLACMARRAKSSAGVEFPAMANLLVTLDGTGRERDGSCCRYRMGADSMA
jgi:hypothetical protein